MSFKLAQTFYVNKGSVKNSEHVTITSLDLFFKSKPLASANRSGILNPGVSIVLLETRDDDIPDVSKVLETGYARCEYDSIVASSDASIVTKFNFSRPVVIRTNKSYAIGVIFDGDEDFTLWSCREGENIVGTNITTSGSTAQNVGKYYEYTSIVGSTSVGSTMESQWKPLNNMDLKFTVYCGVFDENPANESIKATYILPNDSTEYIIFDRYSTGTSEWANASIGDLYYQQTPVIYGPIVVNSNTTTITTSGGVNFSTLLEPTTGVSNQVATSDPTTSKKSYIVLRNGSTQNANVTIREVKAIVSNTQIEVDRLPDFTSNVATFSVTAVGRLAEVRSHWYTGRWWSAASNTMTSYTSKKVDLLRITDTNANTTVRFTNNTVQAITINSGGTGYSNSDVITVYPLVNANTSNPDHINYIESYANGVANVVTNGAGTITGIAITNAGYGLIGNTTFSIATTAGSSANLGLSLGSTIKAEKTTTAMANTIVTNVETHWSIPTIKVMSDQHHDYKSYQHYPYYILSGNEHRLRAATVPFIVEVNTMTDKSNMDLNATDGRTYVLASRSNEVMMTDNVSIKIANGSITPLSIKASSLIEVSITSNNAFSLPMVESDAVYNYKYIINNTAAGENKGAGSALARHISKVVTFAENRDAEDVIVYMDAYKPTGTDIKVYARLHARTDADAFDDKDWTELEIKSKNANTYSSSSNKNDLIEFTYGLPTSPATTNTITGFATVTVSSATVTGVGTAFTTDLAVGDVIKLYSNLFPNTYMVSTVKTVTNATTIVLDDSVTSTDLAASSVQIGFVGRPGLTEIGKPHAAWSDIPSSYISKYYDNNMGVQRGYNSFAIKIVLLSSDASIVPEIENVRALGVSA